MNNNSEIIHKTATQPSATELVKVNKQPLGLSDIFSDIWNGAKDLFSGEVGKQAGNTINQANTTVNKVNNMVDELQKQLPYMKIGLIGFLSIVSIFCIVGTIRDIKEIRIMNIGYKSLRIYEYILIFALVNKKNARYYYTTSI